MRYCRYLKTLTKKLNIIADYAFYNSSIVSITIPKGVESIGNNAFLGCDKLVEVINNSELTITKSIAVDNGYLGYYALNIKKDGTSDVVKNGDYLFYTYDGTNYLVGYTGNASNITLPNSYNGNSYEIYKYAFKNCTDLEKVTISNGVTKIGYKAFCGCTNLTNAVIGSKVEIGFCAFFDTEVDNTRK